MKAYEVRRDPDGSWHWVIPSVVDMNVYWPPKEVLENAYQLGWRDCEAQRDAALLRKKSKELAYQATPSPAMMS